MCSNIARTTSDTCEYGSTLFAISSRARRRSSFKIESTPRSLRDCVLGHQVGQSHLLAIASILALIRRMVGDPPMLLAEFLDFPSLDILDVSGLPSHDDGTGFRLHCAPHNATSGATRFKQNDWPLLLAHFQCLCFYGSNVVRGWCPFHAIDGISPTYPLRQLDMFPTRPRANSPSLTPRRPGRR